MGELARHPDAPKMSETPMEALTRKSNNEGYSLFDRVVHPTVGAVAGMFAVMSYYLQRRRPLYSGLQNYILYMGLGTAMGLYYQDVSFKGREENDAVLRHYISLHPDDFPPYERKRFRDLFFAWEPIR